MPRRGDGVTVYNVSWSSSRSLRGESTRSPLYGNEVTLSELLDGDSHQKDHSPTMHPFS